jgi:hypothetical protein
LDGEIDIDINVSIHPEVYAREIIGEAAKQTQKVKVLVRMVWTRGTM